MLILNYTKFSLYILGMAAISLSACSKGGARSAQPLQPKDRFVDMCIDRFLITVPGDLEISGTKIKAEGPHHFSGILDKGAAGVRYGGFSLYETDTASYEQYKSITRYILGGLTSKKKFDAMLVSTQNAIDFNKTLLADADARQAASIRNTIAEYEAERIDIRRKQARTGQAQTGSADSFAIRDMDDFRGSFFVHADQRVRILDGPIIEPRATGVQRAAELLADFQKAYRAKAAAETPRGPGFCTAHGFISETGNPSSDTKTDVMFRSIQYPGLIFRIKVEPASRELPSDIRSVPGLAVDQSDLHLVGAKDRYGPKSVNLLGSGARVIGYSYGENCSKTSCRPPDQLYAFEAETYGQVGRTDRPRIVLHMSALTSDEYKKNLPDVPGSSYKAITRPALVGQQLPSYDSGKQIFEQVLASIRIR